jgi:hypothetical protein
LCSGLALDVGDSEHTIGSDAGLATSFVDCSHGCARHADGDPATASGGGCLFNISICYDETFKTPHLYVDGEAADSRPLTAHALLQIVTKDMASTTATIEQQHPHYAAREAVHSQVLSLHPCRHAAVMLAIFDAEKEAPNAKVYLKLWLRAISGALRVVIDHA